MNGKRKINGVKFQLERIAEYPIQIKGNMIVLDKLESGNLLIYKPDAEGPVYVQHSSDGSYVMGATRVGEIEISVFMEEKGVIIEKLTCEKGYEYLAKPMINQIEHFVKFYDDFEKVGMDASVYQRWGF